MQFQNDKEALRYWEEYCRNIYRSTDVPTETPAEKQKRINRLLSNFEEFCQFYFPKYASDPFAKFQLKAAKHIIDHDTTYAVLAWSREHAKSVIGGLFIPLFLKFNKKIRNVLYVSHTEDQAKRLIAPIRANLEHNQRFINDFGTQKSLALWQDTNFLTKDGCSFLAIGSGQSPRGSRNEEIRPDMIIFDDIDTDEECRNEIRMDNKWKWIEQAVLPTVSISKSKRILFLGNIIANNSTIVRASRVADFYQKVNILDEKGNPSWSKNLIEDIQYMLSKISYASAQKEYFNNPITEGTVFKELKWGKVPPLSKFKFLCGYADGAYSSKETKSNSFKALILMGEYEGNFYIIKARVEQCSTAKMIQWFFDMKNFVGEKSQIYNYIECNGFQEPWYEDVFRPAVVLAEKTNGSIPISPDDRDKPDKFARIEGNLEPLNRCGQLILNEAEKSDSGMKRLEDQFLAVHPTMSAHADAPDATEGAWWIITNKLRVVQIVTFGKQQRSKYKY